MRRSWFLAAAMAPFCVSPALAASVDAARTTPIATSTADGGPGDVTITANGSIIDTGTAPAVTLDSSNAVSNVGTIQIQNVNDATGVLIRGGNTGSFSNTGAISLVEDFSSPDANTDGVVEAPYAQGSGRIGVRLLGPSPFVGDLYNGGTISVEGNNSKGFSIEGALQGSLVNAGALNVTGDNTKAISISGTVSGVVRIQGAISSHGAGTSAIDITGDIGSNLAVYASVVGTGYGLTTRPTVEDTLNKVQATALELQQSAAAISVAGNLGQGLYIGSPPPGTASDTTADNDGDSLPDNTEQAGSVINYGSAPAILVGSASRTVDLGLFGSGDNAYGVIVRGSVLGSGVYDGASATGMQIGGLGGAVNVAGGIKIFGAVGATTYEAAATALRLGAGATVPVLRVENSLAASVLHSPVATTTSTAAATALLVEAGASLPRIDNIGTIAGSATGDAVTANGVVDRSGSIAFINNLGTISAVVAPATSGLNVAGKAVALDLRANTTGVTLVQNTNPSPIVLAQTTSNNVVVNITSPTAPSIVGDVLLGNGPNKVQIASGFILGALDLGSGASSLTIDNGATYQGDLRHTGGALTIAVNAGNLRTSSTKVLQAQSLTVGAAGVLSVAVDPATGQAGGFQVSGPASFADGAKIGVSLSSILTRAQTYSLIRSSALTVGSSGIGLLGETPYVVVAALRTDTAAGTVNLDLRRRTTAEVGFKTLEGAAYDGVYDSLGVDTALQGALLGQTTQAGFLGLYRQMLPDYAGGVFRLARAGAEATARSAAESDTSPGSLWLQETVYGVDSSANAAASYRGSGFGVVAGLDGPDGSLGRIGATLSFLAGGLRDPDSPGDGLQNFTEFEGGVHWRAEAGGLRLDARGSAGLVSYKSRREFLQTDAAGATLVERLANGKSNGYALSGRFGVGYQFGAARFSVRPQVHLDYFRLTQKGFSETGGGDGFDLTLQDRTGSSTSVTSSVVFTGGLGASRNLHPSLELGYRHGLAGTPGTTTAQFKDGTAFDLEAAPIKGEGGGIARVGLKSSSDYFDLSLTAGAEARSNYLEGDLQFRARVTF